MLRGLRVGWVVAVMAGGLLWVAQVGVGCGSAEDAGSVGNSMEDEGVSPTTYDDSSGSPDCVCLNSGPTDAPEWSCR
jgi:hypothetical protein